MTKGDDIGQVGLQSQNHQVIHHRRVVGIGQIHHHLIIPLDNLVAGLGFGHINPVLPPLQFTFHFANGREVLVQLGLIGFGQERVKSARVLTHHIQDTGVLTKMLPGLGLDLRIILKKQPGKNLCGTTRAGQHHARARPGDTS